jgi:DNA-binding CsgD family transcriptional regulator
MVGMMKIDDLPMPSESLLARIYGLTRAEAAIAQGMARGERLEELAARLGVKMSTARSQLSSIFAKTKTRRQSKLVALLSRLAHLESDAAPEA